MQNWTANFFVFPVKYYCTIILLPADEGAEQLRIQSDSAAEPGKKKKKDKKEKKSKTKEKKEKDKNKKGQPC